MFYFFLYFSIQCDALICFNFIKDTLIPFGKHTNQNQIYFKAIAEEINDWNTSCNHVNCSQIRGCHFTLLQKGIWKSENVRKSIKGWVNHTQNMLAQESEFQTWCNSKHEKSDKEIKKNETQFCEKFGIE